MKNFLESITLIIDTREQDKSIEKTLSVRNIKFVKKALNYGDISFMINDESFENKIVIERKGSLNEVIGNFTKKKRQFENEFKRAKGCKLILMIEADREDIDKGKYISSIQPFEFKERLNTWRYSFGFYIKFLKKSQSVDFILGCFKEYVESK